MSAIDQDEAVLIFNIKRSEYNRGIGLYWLRTWQKQKLNKKIYSVAQTKMLEHSLKVFEWETYRDNFKGFGECYKVRKAGKFYILLAPMEK